MRRTWESYYQPSTVSEALDLLDRFAGQARVIAGGTDVVVELSRGINPTSTLIDITRMPELRGIRDTGETIALGALTTHNDVIASDLITRFAFPLKQACQEIGAPQVRTRATIAGNLITASPANDTISALLALDASVVLISGRGERMLGLKEFFTGFRQTAMGSDELLREIRIPKMTADQRGLFIKLGLRRAQAISVIHIAIVVTLADGVVRDARIALGCLAPTVIRGHRAEAMLIGKTVTADVCAAAGEIVLADVSPIGDIRASAEYRNATLSRLVADGLRQIAAGQDRGSPGTTPVLLDTGTTAPTSTSGSAQITTIETTINGVPTVFGAHVVRATLLDALREGAGLTGAKEGCAEGECGACTVWIDGQAVMACLVPAAQAAGRAISTIEGLQIGDNLHPLQQAFIDEGAVQCGYCIPGMIMAGAKLLEEHPKPTTDETLTALSGNICRCTGYRKILAAMNAVASQSPTGTIER